MLRRTIPALIVPVVLASGVYAQPANDFCSAPEAILGSGSFVWDTFDATTDGDPDAACLFFGNNQVENDVWFCWTPDASGVFAIETCGATLDTKLAVYAGCGSCPPASPIACSDDACGFQSRVTITVTAGQPYLIRVGSFSATATGSGMLTIGEVPPPAVLAGPFSNPANGHDYYLLESSSWTLARYGAESLGGHLVTINDFDENEFVRANVLGFDGVDRRGWLGFNDLENEGDFVWDNGEPVTFTNWNGGEPNNTNGLEHYAEIFGSNGLWNDNTDLPLVTVYGVVELSGGTDPCPADRNGDGTVNASDITVFLSAWFADRSNGTLDADFNGDSTVNASDITEYLGAWFAARAGGGGC